MSTAFDATVIREPLSGVHYAVRRELGAIAACGRIRNPVVFSRDPATRIMAAETGAATPGLPPGMASVAIRALWQQCLLPRVLRRTNAEVLYAMAYTAPLRCPCPVVLNVHDIIALEHPELCAVLNVWHMRLLLPASARRAARIIVSTAHVGDRLRAVLHIPRDRIEVVPMGVDMAPFANPLPFPAWLPVSADARYLLFVGNLEPKKGLPVLLDAFAAVADSLPDVHLVLAGRPAWKSGPLAARIRRHGNARVHVVGRVPDTDLPALYQHALAFCFPSLHEGFGLPVLEAMAAGTAVIHSDHPAVCEAAGHAGVTVRRGDAAALANAMTSVASDEVSRQHLVEAGRTRAATMTWRRRAERVCDILRSVSRNAT